jgi:RimJ/RimL family protein N-acetyltransferase
VDSDETFVDDLRNYRAHDRMIDGRKLVIRAIRPDDKQTLLEGIRRQSAESLYFRFFRPKRHLSDTELVNLTELDFVDHVALVAEVRERGEPTPIGVGRYLISNSSGGSRCAELAFIVDDAWQGRGVGKALLRHLAAIARKAEIQQFVASVLPDNRKMIAVFESSGLPLSRAYSCGLIDIALTLTSDSSVPGETTCDSLDT